MLAPTDTNIADCPVASRSYSIMIQADEPTTLPIDTGVPSFGKATDFTSASASFSHNVKNSRRHTNKKVR